MNYGQAAKRVSQLRLRRQEYSKMYDALSDIAKRIDDIVDGQAIPIIHGLLTIGQLAKKHMDQDLEDLEEILDSKILVSDTEEVEPMK